MEQLKGIDLGKIELNRCENCREIKPLDLANISGKYLRKLIDWKWLCRKCHMTEDGRIKNLKQFIN
jgi:hypothetical protein